MSEVPAAGVRRRGGRVGWSDHGGGVAAGLEPEQVKQQSGSSSTRFSDDEITQLDELVAVGVGDNLSAVVRRAVAPRASSVRRADSNRA